MTGRNKPQTAGDIARLVTINRTRRGSLTQCCAAPNTSFSDSGTAVALRTSPATLRQRATNHTSKQAPTTAHVAAARPAPDSDGLRGGTRTGGAGAGKFAGTKSP